jgi:hypothetical protein
MANILERRVYTPQFSAASSAAVRRLAWAMGRPMTETVEIMVRLFTATVDPSKVCLACQDRTICKSCPFIQPLTAEEKAALLAF